ncbi:MULTISPECIES: GntR family transcriptional regulator [unclassified Microbacterium]|uniref:GntR family transcriptional regulator n=1 Tax=unclassified Microbacterium TaxID=2609290 RepID=UPI000EA84DDC|nr:MULTISPECIES: GntR family transcriptional regulator [unclassified Microbacterium]MBT2484456.1 GntR family transcriptional regulator [Microbacterium sp. ISL-108]RKN67363.1 GntR family transcriptional regulator [Microbacterium sp. CGR2]
MNQQGMLADVLRQRIIDGDFAPGSRLSEAALAEQFDVSRNTLREAFRVLAEQGLVEHIPHRGVSVASPSIADVVDIYRARRVIECAALRQSEPEHPAVQRMRAAVEAAEASSSGAAGRDDGAWRGVGSANMAFHVALVDLADSPRLARTYRNVAAELRLAFLTIDDPRSLHEPFVRRNRAVLTAFVEHGPDAGADELERYLVQSERAVLGAFSRMGTA